MADVFRFSSHSFYFSSSSLPPSFASSYNSLHPSLPPIQNPDKRSSPLPCYTTSCAMPLSFRPRKRLVSFKVHNLSCGRISIVSLLILEIFVGYRVNLCNCLVSSFIYEFSYISTRTPKSCALSCLPDDAWKYLFVGVV